MITKVHFLDILISSPPYFYKKIMGQDRRICSLILRVKELNMAELKVSVVLTNENAQTKGDFLTGAGFSM